MSNYEELDDFLKQYRDSKGTKEEKYAQKVTSTFNIKMENVAATPPFPYGSEL